MSSERQKKVLPYIHLKLIVATSDGQKKEYEFTKEIIKVGRNPDNDIPLLDDQKSSRYHVEILCGTDHVFARNISDKNYLYLNNDEFQEGLIKPGQELLVGSSKIEFKFSSQSQIVAKTSPISVVKDNNLVLNQNLNSIELSQNQLLSPNIKNQNKQINYFENIQDSISDPFNSKMKYANEKNKKILIPFVLGLMGLVIVILIFSDTSKNKNSKITLRDSITTQQSIQKSEAEIEKIEKEKSNRNQIAYEMAQQQFIKGFRDYRNGNYIRAMEQFAAALSFSSDHAQARRYYHLAKRKNEEMAQFHFNLGKRYYGIQNYRLCSSHFSTVLRLKREESDNLRKEALMYYKECDLKQEGRF